MKSFSRKVAKLSAASILCLGFILTGALSACTEQPDSGNNVVDISDVVSVTGGKIQGKYIEDNTIVEYKGIPYAASPTGENRWKAPQDVEAWEGVKQCTEWGNSAYQAEQSAALYWTDEFIISNKVYSEDCLTLNVWTQNEDTVADRPVIVYIHGGAFSAGGSSCEIYEGQDIAKKGAVYVSINYRVGLFGFFSNSDLSAEDENGSSGNYGLMDQIKALEWVRDNIAQFGGDANNVTIMGQSAGAASVDYLTVSPVAKGLFKRAVACSYDALNDPLKMLTYIGTQRERNVTNDALTEGYTLEQLRAMSTEDVSALLGRASTGGPCIDGYVVPKSYGDALTSGALDDIDLMAGVVDNDSNEGAMALDRALFLSEHDDTFTAGDSMMASVNAIAVGRKNAKDTGATYIYKFSQVMPGSVSAMDHTTPVQYAFHTSDIPYFLNHLSDLRAEYWTDADRTTANVASSYLVNFAKTGNPNGDGLPTWTACTGNYSYMEIKEKSEQQTFTADQITNITTYLKATGKLRFPELYI